MDILPFNSQEVSQITSLNLFFEMLKAELHTVLPPTKQNRFELYQELEKKKNIYGDSH